MAVRKIKNHRCKLLEGFTLVELLVVVAIMALLLSIMLPSLSAAREKAKQVKCLANLKDLTTTSILYAQIGTSEIIVPSPSRKGCGG